MRKLSVIICCFNEQATISDVISGTKAVELGPNWDREILIVDNLSTDGTREILQQIDDAEIKTFFHERNMGKGMSIRTGIANMNGDYMIIQDADAEYDPSDHVLFCRKADETDADAIFGSRVLGGNVQYEYAHAYLGVRLLTAVTNILFDGHLTDVATATKMVRADVVQKLNLTTTDFNLDFELPDKILLSGHEIIEIPISYDPRTYAEGKKITSSDGIRALLTMIKDRLGFTPVLKEDAQNKHDDNEHVAE